MAAPARPHVAVSRSLCIGSGLCTDIAPRIFTFTADGKARAGRVEAADLAKARDAALACPARAILIRQAAAGAALRPPAANGTHAAERQPAR